MITVTIDGKVIQTDKPKFIIDLARENGIDIPNLCYDKNLAVVSACRLCLVEVEGSKKINDCLFYFGKRQHGCSY